MNTRLQVEHPVTEAVTGIDLVEQQLRVAAGLAADLRPRRARPARARDRAAGQRRGPEALPARPGRDHRPGWSRPATGVRVDAGYAAGTTVTPHYDSLMAKLIVHGADRAEALARARAAVAGFEVDGPEVQPAVLRRAAGQPGVRLRRLRHRHRRPDACPGMRCRTRRIVRCRVPMRTAAGVEAADE